MDDDVKMASVIIAGICGVVFSIIIGLTVQINYYTSRGYTKTSLPGLAGTQWVLPQEEVNHE